MSEHNSRRIQNTTRVGKLTLTPHELGGVQRMQVRLNAFEVLDNINSMQLFGFASSPPIGSDAVILCLSGETTNSNVIATNHNAYRPSVIGSGETIIYDTAAQRIYLSQTGGHLKITIAAGNEVDIVCDTAVNITAPTVTVTGNLVVTGTIISAGNMTAAGIDLDTHHHSGVQTGAGNTGGPIG